MVAHACNLSYSGGWGRRIAWTQEAEVAVSWDHAIALQSGQQERNSVSKKKKKFCCAWVFSFTRVNLFIRILTILMQWKQYNACWARWLMPVIPALWEAGTQGSPEPSSLRAAWATRQNLISTKNAISQAWWHVPVVPATWEAEVEGSLEPRRLSLQWAVIMPLHSSLGNRARNLFPPPASKNKIKL